MKEISISFILNNTNDENNYEDDIWKICLDEKGKRYKRKDISTALKKLTVLGFIKKNKISSTDKYYTKISYSNPEDYLGFVNDLIFSNESKIKESIKKLENKKIFADISKDINSYKLNKTIKTHFEKLLDSFSNMTEISSSILLVKDSTNNTKFKKQLTTCYEEIKETLEFVSKKIIIDRKANEIILLKRQFTGRIPNTGHLKL
jgi:hypothetical protein